MTTPIAPKIILIRINNIIPPTSIPELSKGLYYIANSKRNASPVVNIITRPPLRLTLSIFSYATIQATTGLSFKRIR